MIHQQINHGGLPTPPSSPSLGSPESARGISPTPSLESSLGLDNSFDSGASTSDSEMDSKMRPVDPLVIFGSQRIDKTSTTPYSDATKVGTEIILYNSFFTSNCLPELSC